MLLSIIYKVYKFLFCFPVIPAVNIIAPPEQTYKSQYVLTCTVSFPTKLFSHIIPYTMVVWSRDGMLIAGTEVQETYNDGVSLKRNLSFTSLNESHNGRYICQVFIHFQDNDRPISRKTSYSIRVKGIRKYSAL